MPFDRNREMVSFTRPPTDEEIKASVQRTVDATGLAPKGPGTGAAQVRLDDALIAGTLDRAAKLAAWYENTKNLTHQERIHAALSADDDIRAEVLASLEDDPDLLRAEVRDSIVERAAAAGEMLSEEEIDDRTLEEGKRIIAEDVRTEVLALERAFEGLKAEPVQVTDPSKFDSPGDDLERLGLVVNDPVTGGPMEHVWDPKLQVGQCFPLGMLTDEMRRLIRGGEWTKEEMEKRGFGISSVTTSDGKTDQEMNVAPDFNPWASKGGTTEDLDTWIKGAVKQTKKLLDDCMCPACQARRKSGLPPLPPSINFAGVSFPARGDLFKDLPESEEGQEIIRLINEHNTEALLGKMGKADALASLEKVTAKLNEWVAKKTGGEVKLDPTVKIFDNDGNPKEATVEDLKGLAGAAKGIFESYTNETMNKIILSAMGRILTDKEDHAEVRIAVAKALGKILG